MKKLFILILILFPLLVHGENLKLSELTAVTSAGVESEDLLLVTINPTDPVAESDGGTRASRKVTLGNLLLWMATQTWTFSDSIGITKVNAAGGSADALTLSGTLGIMDGSDTFRGIYLNYTNADHTGSSNNIYGILINDITGDSEADEVALKIGLGWDYGIHTYSPIVIYGNGSTTPGYLYLEDADNSNFLTISAPVAISASYNLYFPSAPSAYDSGLLGCSTDGTCSWIDPSSLLTSVDLSSVTISGGTASRMAEWDGSGNLTSSDTATTGTGAPVKAVSPTLTGIPKTTITRNATNETWGGTSLYFAECAASMGFGQPAYMQSTGKPGLADADGVATMPAIGLVVVASTDADTPCTILTHGVITDTDWNWTVGNTIYVADGDAGALTATVGDISDTNDVVQVVGIAIHADSIFVSPSLSVVVLE